MQRKNYVVQCQTFSVKDLIRCQTSRGSLPTLKDFSNDSDSQRVTWNNMPTSDQVTEYMKNSGFKAQKQKQITDNLDTKVENAVINSKL